MRTLFFIISFSLISSLNFSVEAQNDFAKLERNVNIRAKGLLQNLNSTKDTLILKSESLINKVYSINTDYKREIDVSINEKSIKIPLTKLSKGKHIFVAVQSPVRIVFVVKILRDNEILLAMEDKKLVVKNEEK